MEAESDIWQRCARKFSLNTPLQLSILGSTLQMIIQNCLDNPTDQKYFKIKTSGKTFQTKIATYEGGVDFLIACGFISVVIDNEKYFHLIEFDKEHLDLCMSWLFNTVCTCHEMRQRHKISPTDITPCAECTIQIRLPNNTTAVGGFMRNDTIRELLSFSSCYFQFGSTITLRLPSSTHSITSNETDLNKTLEELSLYPRAILIASRLADDELESAMEKSMEAAKVRAKHEEKQQKVMRVERKQTAEERNQEKQKILLLYRDDRLDAKPPSSVFNASSSSAPLPLADDVSAATAAAVNSTATEIVTIIDESEDAGTDT